MEKDEFIEELGIEGEQNFDDTGSLVITLDENGWSSAQVKLDTCEELDEDEESSSISYESSNLQYVNEYFIINLIADFQANEYKLTIKDR